VPKPRQRKRPRVERKCATCAHWKKQFFDERDLAQHRLRVGAELENQLSALRREQEKLRAQLTSSQAEALNLSGIVAPELVAANSRIAELTATLDTTQGHLNDWKRNYYDLEARMMRHYHDVHNGSSLGVGMAPTQKANASQGACKAKPFWRRSFTELFRRGGA